VETGGRREASGLRLVDRLLLVFLAVAAVVALVRANDRPTTWWALAAYLLIAIMVGLLSRPGLGILGRSIREVYPLLLLVPIYSSLDLLNGMDQVSIYDALVRGWEETLFNEQVSQTWWQRAPSRFLSAIFHLSYFSYYVIVPLPLAWFAIRRDVRSLRRSVLIIFTTFLVCYLCFILFPVAGPYYEFPRPASWFLDNPSARLVYATLSTGSSYGAAFPSSHVAGTVAAAISGWLGSRMLGWILLVPTALLTVGVIYTQMHYAVDAIAGVLVGVAVAVSLARLSFDRRLESGSRR
jgi:membrane-associated phospholipid phosphatase